MNRRFFTLSTCGYAILLTLVLALAIGPRFVEATLSVRPVAAMTSPTQWAFHRA